MIKEKKRQESNDGTVKFLFELADGNRVETVLMRHPYGNSVCVSSQAGCSMGCVFCASGFVKKDRNLKAEEMLDQVMAADVFLKQDKTDPAPDHGKSEKVTHVVVMGTGEPFDNFDEVIRFCDMVSDEKKIENFISCAAADGHGKSTDHQQKIKYIMESVVPRHITVSTCGLVPGILKFAETEKRYNLAVSLHAPDDEIRSRLMPVNKKYPIEELIRAGAGYCSITKRRVAFEYLLLKGVNDTDACAEKLARLLLDGERLIKNGKSGQEGRFYVNLIPFNRLAELPYEGSGKDRALAFYDILMKRGVKATLRKERGADIMAACGQLRVGENDKRTVPLSH